VSFLRFLKVMWVKNRTVGKTQNMRKVQNSGEKNRILGKPYRFVHLEHVLVLSERIMMN